MVLSWLSCDREDAGRFIDQAGLKNKVAGVTTHGGRFRETELFLAVFETFVPSGSHASIQMIRTDLTRKEI